MTGRREANRFARYVLPPLKVWIDTASHLLPILFPSPCRGGEGVGLKDIERSAASARSRLPATSNRWLHRRPGTGCFANPSSDLDQRFLQDIVRPQGIRVQVHVAVLSSMDEPPPLLFILGACPVQVLASGASLKGSVKEHQDIGAAQPLPHVGDIGVLLGDLAGGPSVLLETPCQGRLAGGARADNGDPPRRPRSLEGVGVQSSSR